MIASKRYPKLNWSLNRHQTFLDCRRRYFHAYYNASGGNQRSASQISKDAFRLKTLTSVEMLYGSMVHDEMNRIANQLHDESRPLSHEKEEKEIAERIRKSLNEAYFNSKYKLNDWFRSPSDYKVLHEMYYQKHLPEEKVQGIRGKLDLTAKQMLLCRTIDEIVSKGKKAKIINAEKFREFEVNGIKVWVVLDLLFHDMETDRYVIVDYKTSKRSDKDRTQMLLYAWYIKEKYNIESLNQIELRNEYLSDGTSNSFTPASFDIESIKYIFETSTNFMKSLLHDVDQNVPLSEEMFEETQNKKMCLRCPFLEICGEKR